MDVGSGPEGYDTVELTSKRGECLVVSVPSTVGIGTGEASGVEVVFLLEFMAVEGDKGRKVEEMIK